MRRWAAAAAAAALEGIWSLCIETCSWCRFPVELQRGSRQLLPLGCSPASLILPSATHCLEVVCLHCAAPCCAAAECCAHGAADPQGQDQPAQGPAGHQLHSQGLPACLPAWFKCGESTELLSTPP